MRWLSVGIWIYSSWFWFSSKQRPCGAINKSNQQWAEILELAGAGGSTVVSNAGVVDMTAAASGGDGSYSFAWTVTELSDRGTHSIAAQGTQNAAQYNTLTIQSVLPAGGGEPVEAEYRLGCTVTDGNSDTASGQVDIVVVSFGL